MVNALSKDTKEDIIQNGTVQYSVVLSLEQAQKSLLKDREDILALLTSGTDTLGAHILLLFTRSAHSGGVLSLRVFALNTAQASSEGIASAIGRRPLQELLSLPIPEPENVGSEGSNLTLHAPSATLYQYSPKSLAVYNLSCMVARRTHHTPLGHTPIETCLRLSSCSVVVNTATSVSIIDTQYHSIQAEFSLEAHKNRTVDQVSKKDRIKNSEAKSTRLLSYFAPSEILVALQGRRLIGIQLSISGEKEGSRKRKRAGLLINSIGRGINAMHEKSTKNRASSNLPKSLGTYLSSSHSDDNWSKKRKFLDQCFAKGEIERFESLINNELGITARENADISVKRPTHNTPDQHKIQYLLSNIFSLDIPPATSEGSDSFRKLKIRFFPTDIFSYLFRTGLLSVDGIEIALKHHGVLPLTDHIANGALIHALAEWDPSLKVLQSLVESIVPLTAQELAHALQISLNLARVAESSDNTKFITNGEPRNDGGSDHDMHLNSEIPSSPPAPHPDSDNTSAAHQLLHLALTRLATHSSKTIIRALRTTLSPTLLLHLVDHLRISLARAGWLTPYTEPPPSLPLTHDLNHNSKADKHTQLSTIAKLLNSLLDAIGSAGWLTSTLNSGAASETADTIAYMNAEISAALEGVEEATYLRNMLGEVLLYAASYETSLEKKETDRQKKMMMKAPAAGQQRTIITAPMDETGGLRNALPLGLKANQEVEPTKVGAGGEVMERTRRDIGRLKDRGVPKYSFERILV